MTVAIYGLHIERLSGLVLISIKTTSNNERAVSLTHNWVVAALRVQVVVQVVVKVKTKASNFVS